MTPTETESRCFPPTPASPGIESDLREDARTSSSQAQVARLVFERGCDSRQTAEEDLRRCVKQEATPESHREAALKRGQRRTCVPTCVDVGDGAISTSHPTSTQTPPENGTVFFPFDSGLERFSIAGSRNDFWCNNDDDDGGDNAFVENGRQGWARSAQEVKRERKRKFFFILEKVTKVERSGRDTFSLSKSEKCAGERDRERERNFINKS